MTRTWIVIVALAAGCTSFDTLDRNRCGNGLLEPGEDCDSPDASCVQCAVVCTTVDACPTTDYTCGVDGFCHAPGGELAAAVNAGTFQTNDYRITDIDHDGTGDVLGLSKTSLVIRYGDAAGDLAKLDSIVTPSQTGPAAFGDLDLDHSLDVTITTPDGIVAYTSPFGKLTPAAVPSELTGMSGEPLDIRLLFHLGGTSFGGFITDGTHVFALAADLANPTTTSIGPPCLARVGQTPVASFSTATVDSYQVNKDSDGTIDDVVSMIIGSGANAKLCVMSIHRDPLPAAFTIVDITPVNATAPAKKPFLADLNIVNTDRCPGLVNTDGAAAALRYWDGALASGHCTLKPSASPTGDPLPPVAMAPPNSTVVGHIVLDPPLLLVAPDALVLADGPYAYSPTFNTFSDTLYHSNRKLAGAAVADLDNDGDLDAVLIPAGEDDLDILYRAGLGYQLLRLDTASEVTTVTLDDYDGNSIKDIAYTERIGDHQRLMISYSTTDQPLPPVETGTFTDIVSVVRMQLYDSVDILQLAADLAVLQSPVGSHAATMTLLHGSPQRTMLPYFDPRAMNQQANTFFGTVIGQFAQINGEAKSYRDIVLFAPPDATATPGAKVKAFTVAGASDVLDANAVVGADVTGLADCAGGPAASNLCIQDPAYFAWPVSSTKDVVLAVDRELPPHAAVLDPWTSTTSLAATPAPALIPSGLANIQIRSLHAADADGDGVADLIATFAAMGNGRASAVQVCQVAVGIPQSCTDLVPVITTLEPATTVCLDAAPARVTYRDPTITPTSASDVVVLCRDDGSTIYRVHHETDGYHADKLVHATGQLTMVRTGDVTGDGVDDVIALQGDRGAQSLVVYRQCTSRDQATCQHDTTTGAHP
jgi:hypothetical protein